MLPSTVCIIRTKDVLTFETLPPCSPSHLEALCLGSHFPAYGIVMNGKKANFIMKKNSRHRKKKCSKSKTRVLKKC